MSIIDRKLVTIEISPIAGKQTGGLRLNYQDQTYDLVQAFASQQRELVQRRLQQLIDANNSGVNLAMPDRYLAIHEEHYYSIWVVSLTQNQANILQQSQRDLELQQASIWLFQELWFQCQDLLGVQQLQVLIDNLLMANPHIQSLRDVDLLLGLDPSSSVMLMNWIPSDFVGLDRQLYQLIQKKIGREFGRTLTTDIIQSMPDSLRSILVDILDIN